MTNLEGSIGGWSTGRDYKHSSYYITVMLTVFKCIHALNKTDEFCVLLSNIAVRHLSVAYSKKNSSLVLNILLCKYS